MEARRQALGMLRPPSRRSGARGAGARARPWRAPSLPPAYTGHGGDIVGVTMKVQAAHHTCRVGTAVTGGIQ